MISNVLNIKVLFLLICASINSGVNKNSRLFESSAWEGHFLEILPINTCPLWHCTAYSAKDRGAAHYSALFFGYMCVGVEHLCVDLLHFFKAHNPESKPLIGWSSLLIVKTEREKVERMRKRGRSLDQSVPPNLLCVWKHVSGGFKRKKIINGTKKV